MYNIFIRWYDIGPDEQQQLQVYVHVYNCMYKMGEGVLLHQGLQTGLASSKSIFGDEEENDCWDGDSSMTWLLVVSLVQLSSSNGELVSSWRRYDSGDSLLSNDEQLLVGEGERPLRPSKRFRYKSKCWLSRCSKPMGANDRWLSNRSRTTRAHSLKPALNFEASSPCCCCCCCCSDTCLCCSPCSFWTWLTVNSRMSAFSSFVGRLPWLFK